MKNNQVRGAIEEVRTRHPQGPDGTQSTEDGTNASPDSHKGREMGTESAGDDGEDDGSKGKVCKGSDGSKDAFLLRRGPLDPGPRTAASNDELLHTVLCILVYAS